MRKEEEMVQCPMLGKVIGSTKCISIRRQPTREEMMGNPVAVYDRVPCFNCKEGIRIERKLAERRAVKRLEEGWGGLKLEICADCGDPFPVRYGKVGICHRCISRRGAMARTKRKAVYEGE